MKRLSRKIPYIIIGILLTVLCFVSLVRADEPLTPLQKAESDLIKAMVAEANDNLPPDTIITRETINLPVQNMVKILEKNGYSSDEYYIDGGAYEIGGVLIACYDFYIKLKTMSGKWVGQAYYRFNSHKNAI